MFQLIVIKTTDGAAVLQYANLGVVDLIGNESLIETQRRYESTERDLIAIAPLHITKELDNTYSVYVYELRGDYLTKPGTQVLFVGSVFSELLTEDNANQLINNYARYPGDRLNRADAMGLAATVLGPQYQIVPPEGLNANYWVYGICVPTAPEDFALVVKSETMGTLPIMRGLSRIFHKE